MKQQRPMLTQRYGFGAHFPIGAQRVCIPSVQTMSSSDEEAFLQAFNHYGFAILRCEAQGDRRTDLLGLKALLGDATQHPRADRDGVVPIDNLKPIPGHIDSSHHEHRLHTDGSFSDHPEKIIALQCERPARSGGFSVLASASAAYAHLATLYHDRVEALSNGNALTIKRTTASSTRPIFARDGNTCSIKFRMPDSAAEVTPAPEVQDLFEELCRFFLAPENRLVFQLQPGEILIGDNTAVVHGRTAFDPQEPRFLRRLNFDASGVLCQRMMFGFVPQKPGCAAACAVSETSETLAEID